ncbi:MAG: hypothetical protein ACRDR6_15400 [Pseudonocardiaceae bacterium]
MCMLTYFPAGKLPDVEALHNGAEFNRDGHGFAIVSGHRIIVQRGMDFDTVVKKFTGLRATYPDGRALFHSRFGTHGTRRKSNCHPFRVGGDPRTVVAHNGILPKVTQPTDGDRRSDTRIAAEEWFSLQSFADLDSLHTRHRLGQWITRANKLVFLTVHPRYQQNAYLINEYAGIWDDGIWYSNDDYIPYSRYRSYLHDDAPLRDYQPRCEMCLEWSIDPESRICQTCDCCNDCMEWAQYCQCYLPHPRHDSDSELVTWKADQR